MADQFFVEIDENLMILCLEESLNLKPTMPSYQAAYDIFMAWIKSNKILAITGDVFLQYFKEQEKIWTPARMLYR